MKETVITFGLVCIAAAIIGGNINALNVQIPALKKPRPRIYISIFGVILIVSGFAQDIAGWYSGEPSSCPPIGVVENNEPYLQVSLVMHDEGDNAADIDGLFLQLINDIRRNAPAFPFRGVKIRSSSYGDAPALYSQGTIASLRPIMYLSKKDAVPLIPVMVVRKQGERNPYYNGNLVVSSTSSIKDIRSPDIKKILLGDKTSLSGYVGPLFSLYKNGIITTPSVKGIEDHGWKFEVVGSHEEVLKRVKEDVTVVGAIGNLSSLDERASGVRVIEKSVTYPQDFIVISQDLMPYRDDIYAWLSNLSSDSCMLRVLGSSKAQITGLQPIPEVVKSMYVDLDSMFRLVKREMQP